MPEMYMNLFIMFTKVCFGHKIDSQRRDQSFIMFMKVWFGHEIRVSMSTSIFCNCSDYLLGWWNVEVLQ